MTKLLIATAHRSVSPETCSGYLYVFDTETSRFLCEVEGLEPPFRDRDENPRGGARGMRGISVYGGQLAVSNYSCVFCFDKHWSLQHIVTHPVCAGIHDISLAEDGVWITSAVNDLLLKVAFSGDLLRVYSLRDHRDVIRTLKTDPGMLNGLVLKGGIDFRDRANFNTETYDHLHVNSFAWTRHGDLIVSLGWIVGRQLGLLLALKAWLIHTHLWNAVLEINRKVRRVFNLQKQMLTELALRPVNGSSALLRITPQGTSQIVLPLQDVHVPSHSILILNNGLAVYLFTSRGEVIHFDPEDGKILSQTHVTEEFLRGIALVGQDLLVLGAGTELIFFDLSECRVVKRFHVSNRAQESIFSIQILPNDFDLPPADLAKRVGKITGFNGQRVVRE